MSSENLDSMQYSRTIKCENASGNGEIVKLDPELVVELENVPASYKLVLNDENDLFNIKHENEPNREQCDFSTKSFENNLCCIPCNFKATNKKELETHVTVHVQANNLFQNQTSKKQFVYLKYSTDTESYECYHCGYKTIKRNTFLHHLLIHSHVKRYQCDKCEYKTNRKCYLTSHVEKHSNIKKYECDKCEYKTDWKYNLKSHALKHSVIKKYQCNKCEFKTAIERYLKRHLVKHTYFEKYQCDQCNFKTIYKRSLSTHLSKHAGGKYQCYHCKYKTINKRLLMQHLLKHRC